MTLTGFKPHYLLNYFAQFFPTYKMRLNFSTEYHFSYQDTREGVLWLAVHHHQQKALGIFSMEVASAGTGMGLY
jgi:hypothetical protein